MSTGEEPGNKGGSDSTLPIHEAKTVFHGPDADFGPAPAPAGAGPAPAGVTSLDEFSRSLIAIGLIEPGELEDFAADSALGVLGLSRALVKAGKLTPYQAAAVYQKKSRGLLIGNYLILDKLGQGGMGVVFKARHRRLGRVGALKILPPSFARDRSAVMRFRREVEAAGRLKHPNLVAALDADEDRGVHFLVMDYVEGRDLDRVVRDRGPLPIAQAVDCLIQAARGLEAAHAEGIVHRDIKPGNLMLDSAGRVRVLDLGLARIVDAANPFSKTAGGRLTESGMYMGTVDYMAPEQAEDSHRVDHRADIYGLGCTLYYLLTGQEPFPGETVLKRLIAHMERPAPSLRTARPGVSPALEAAYQRLVAKRPDDRPASMTEVIALLEASKVAAAEVKAPGAARPESRPELMVFDEAPLKRVALPKTKTDPSIFARREEPEGLMIGRELSLEDLVMDVRREAAPAPIRPALKPVSATTRSLSRSAPTRSRGRPNRLGLVVFALAAIAVLGVSFVRLVLFPGSVPSSDSRSSTVRRAPLDRVKNEGFERLPDQHSAIPGSEIVQELHTTRVGSIKLKRIPAGTFLMGALEADADADPDEKPQHRVQITRPFYLGVYEVTQAQYEAVMGENPSHFASTGAGSATVAGQSTGRHPVENVSWLQAVWFCNALSRIEGLTPFYHVNGDNVEIPDRNASGYRLPTEAEWEYACRANAPTPTIYSSGDDPRSVESIAWYGANSKDRTHSVGEKLPNGFGLFDMNGNVCEWCWDRAPDGEVSASAYYLQSPATDPPGPNEDPERRYRGGAWNLKGPQGLRLSWRSCREPRDQRSHIGFRLALTASNTVLE